MYVSSNERFHANVAQIDHSHQKKYTYKKVRVGFSFSYSHQHLWSNMAAISTPPRSQRNLNAFKRIYSSPSSVTPNSKPKTKKTKEDDPEEEKVEKISLKDVYDLVKQLKSDIDTKYNTISAKVEALEKQISTVEVKLKCL